MEELDVLGRIGSQLPALFLFVAYTLLLGRMHAKERVQVQENFAEFLKPHSESQAQVATAITLLSKELHVMIATNAAEHQEIIRLVAKSGGRPRGT